MFAWIAENAATVVAAAAVLIVIGLAVFFLVRDKKKGKGGCTGNCATCGMNCSCGKSKQ
ncbi:MAG: FeoB-associated Cys-rich membrane protein [Clostridia bacterium]|nr:FeoB-associated Cys-rich membrane protein [Clostridia bacterium]